MVEVFRNDRSEVSSRVVQPGSGQVDKNAGVVAIIVTFNSSAHIDDCLSSIDDVPVLVVDNSSSDDTLDRIARYPHVRVVALSSNVGLSAAFNIGWRSLAAPAVLFLNPDIVVPDGAVDRLAAISAGLGQYCVLAPELVYPDRSLQNTARSFPTLWTALARRSVLGGTRWGLRRVQNHLQPSTQTDEAGGERVVDWVLGAAMLIPRQSLERLDGFDPRYFLYCEDVDFCARGWRVGLPTFYTRQVSFVHKYQRESSRSWDLRSRATRAHIVSSMLLGVRFPFQFFGLAPITRSGNTFEFQQSDQTSSDDPPTPNITSGGDKR